MPFHTNKPGHARDVEDEARRDYLDAVRDYDSGAAESAAKSMAAVVKVLHAHYGRPSSLLGSATNAQDAIFFACVDLLGRSLRKMWYLDEAQLVFSVGIKWALVCPEAHRWANEYYSRWVSVIGRRDTVRAVSDSEPGLARFYAKVKKMLGRGEQAPGSDALAAIRAILTALGAVEPYEDDLLMELHEYAKQDFFPDFEELARRVHAWGWKDEPFAS